MGIGNSSKSGCCSGGGGGSHGHSHGGGSHGHSHAHGNKKGPCCAGCGYEEYFKKEKKNPVLEPRMASLFAEEGLQNNDLVRPYTLMKHKIRNSRPVNSKYLMGWQEISSYKEPSSNFHPDLEILYRQNT